MLADRVGTDASDRPMVAGADDARARLTELRGHRDQDYAAAAACTVRTDGKAPEEVAAQILDWAIHQPGLLTPDELGGLG